MHDMTHTAFELIKICLQHRQALEAEAVDRIGLAMDRLEAGRSEFLAATASLTSPTAPVPATLQQAEAAVEDDWKALRAQIAHATGV